MTEQLQDEMVVDRFVEALVDNGTEYLFLNPGTDTAPLLEAIAVRDARGLRSPAVVLCVHEAVALAAAHGYFMVSGRPQVVVVHVDVGTQNLGAMLHNVWRSEIGVVIFAGRTPVISTGTVPGMRDLPVHWQQDVPDQDGIVRAYAKSVVELRMPELIDQQVNRAFQLATATPPGAAYLTAGREALMASTAGAGRRHPSSGAVPARYAPDAATTTEFARLLADADRPVLTTSRVGRDPAAVPELVALANRLGAPIVDRRERMNFPSDHPLYLRTAADSRRAMETADLVVVVDSDVPWVPSRVGPAADARVVHIGTDPIRADSPNWDFPSDLTIQSDALHALRAINAALADRGPRDHWFAASPPAAPDEPTDGSPISSQEVFETLDALLAADDIVVEEVTTNGDAMREHLGRTLPGTHFQSGGSGLGWSLGASIGAKIARPETRVVTVVGDGAFMFNNPAAALWTSTHEQAAILVVVLDNGGYAASRRPILDLYPHGAYADAPRAFGTAFEGSIDYAELARSCGFDGETVTLRGDLRATLERAVAAVDAGRGALVVVRVGSPWLPAT